MSQTRAAATRRRARRKERRPPRSPTVLSAEFEVELDDAALALLVECAVCGCSAGTPCEEEQEPTSVPTGAEDKIETEEQTQ